MYRDSQLGLCLDLSGPDGNAYAIMGYARDFARQCEKDWKSIEKEMLAGTYENVVAVFAREFPIVTLVNPPRSVAFVLGLPETECDE